MCARVRRQRGVVRQPSSRNDPHAVAALRGLGCDSGGRGRAAAAGTRGGNGRVFSAWRICRLCRWDSNLGALAALASLLRTVRRDLGTKLGTCGATGSRHRKECQAAALNVSLKMFVYFICARLRLFMYFICTRLRLFMYFICARLRLFVYFICARLRLFVYFICVRSAPPSLLREELALHL
eukprot:SAG11_NODE_2675_length_3106_cov_2.195211_4_plen_182_part_00